MNEITNARIEFLLEVLYPEIGAKDETKVSLDLVSHPGLENIIGNFYYFLLKLGVDKELASSYINLNTELSDDDFDDEEEEYEPEESYLDKKIKIKPDPIKIQIKSDIKNLKKKEDFLSKLNSNEKFLEQVFEIFLSSMLREEII
jgi:hypothetical protein